MKEYLPESKVCAKCKIRKPQIEFALNTSRVDGLQSWCNKCCKNIRLRQGIKSTQYKTMLKSQNNVCAICGQPETVKDGRTGKIFSLAVDHCHKTGKIRALLCMQCNRSLGGFNHNPELLQKATDYLESHSSEAAT